MHCLRGISSEALTNILNILHMLKIEKYGTFKDEGTHILLLYTFILTNNVTLWKN